MCIKHNVIILKMEEKMIVIYIVVQQKGIYSHLPILSTMGWYLIVDIIK